MDYEIYNGVRLPPFLLLKDNIVKTVERELYLSDDVEDYIYASLRYSQAVVPLYPHFQLMSFNYDGVEVFWGRNFFETIAIYMFFFSDLLQRSGKLKGISNVLIVPKNMCSILNKKYPDYSKCLCENVFNSGSPLIKYGSIINHLVENNLGWFEWYLSLVYRCIHPEDTLPEDGNSFIEVLVSDEVVVDIVKTVSEVYRGSVDVIGRVVKYRATLDTVLSSLLLAIYRVSATIGVIYPYLVFGSILGIGFDYWRVISRYDIWRTGRLGDVIEDIRRYAQEIDYAIGEIIKSYIGVSYNITECIDSDTIICKLRKLIMEILNGDSTMIERWIGSGSLFVDLLDDNLSYYRLGIGSYIYEVDPNIKLVSVSEQLSEEYIKLLAELNDFVVIDVGDTPKKAMLVAPLLEILRDTVKGYNVFALPRSIAYFCRSRNIVGGFGVDVIGI